MCEAMIWGTFCLISYWLSVVEQGFIIPGKKWTMSSGLQVYTEVNKGQLNKTHQENPVSQNLAWYTARKRIPRYPFVRNKKKNISMIYLYLTFLMAGQLAHCRKRKEKKCIKCDHRIIGFKVQYTIIYSYCTNSHYKSAL